MDLLKDKMVNETNYHILFVTLVIMLLTIVVFVGLFWMFYRLLYGILLQKLNSNYKELKKIDL